MLSVHGRRVHGLHEHWSGSVVALVVGTGRFGQGADFVVLWVAWHRSRVFRDGPGRKGAARAVNKHVFLVCFLKSGVFGL